MPVEKQTAHHALPLTPAMVWILMVGRFPSARLKGWVALAQGGQFGEPTVEDVWAAHRDDLTAMAQRHGFEPYQLTRRKPAGPEFEKWEAAFVLAHRY